MKKTNFVSQENLQEQNALMSNAHQGMHCPLSEKANIGEKKNLVGANWPAITRDNEQLTVDVLVTNVNAWGTEGFGAEMKEAKKLVLNFVLTQFTLELKNTKSTMPPFIKIKLAKSAQCNYLLRQVKHRLMDSMACRAECEV